MAPDGPDGPDAQAEPAPVLRCGGPEGALQVNELLALPSGRAQGRQWVELANVGREPVCLGGAELEVGTAWRSRRHVIEAPLCLAPGGLLLLGDATAALRTAHAGLAVAYAYGALPLPADAGRVAVVCGARVLAELDYGGPGEAASPVGGRALARQVDAEGAVRWCNVAGPSYDGYDVGSPGAPNPGCTLCRDAEGWRALRPPGRGELTVQAVQADPPGRDRGREWLVLQATGARSVDLWGLTLAAEVVGRPERRWRLRAPGCTPLQPGQARRVVVGCRPRGPPPKLPFWLGPTLPNRTATLRVFDLDGALVDEASLPVLPHHAGVRRLAEGAP